MYLLIDHEEHRLLLELAETRIQEILPEIRRCKNLDYQQQLKAELERLRRLARRLHDAECDVSA